jgi:hypothetical protein
VLKKQLAHAARLPSRLIWPLAQSRTVQPHILNNPSGSVRVYYMLSKFMVYQWLVYC